MNKNFYEELRNMESNLFLKYLDNDMVKRFSYLNRKDEEEEFKLAILKLKHNAISCYQGDEYREPDSFEIERTYFNDIKKKNGEDYICETIGGKLQKTPQRFITEVLNMIDKEDTEDYIALIGNDLQLELQLYESMEKYMPYKIKNRYEEAYRYEDFYEVPLYSVDDDIAKVIYKDNYYPFRIEVIEIENMLEKCFLDELTGINADYFIEEKIKEKISKMRYLRHYIKKGFPLRGLLKYLYK